MALNQEEAASGHAPLESWITSFPFQWNMQFDVRSSLRVLSRSHANRFEYPQRLDQIWTASVPEWFRRGLGVQRRRRGLRLPGVTDKKLLLLVILTHLDEEQWRENNAELGNSSHKNEKWQWLCNILFDIEIQVSETQSADPTKL